jgi:2-amino-4-hydroxy-6-hydroxymethyldihydropteridine diphosphokinase
LVANAVPVAIALGSNQGNRERLLTSAVTALSAHLSDITVSTFHDTAPVGVVDQPRFLNAAAIGHTTHPPADLLRVLLGIERQFGRERPFQGAPRTLDLDLILYGDVVLQGPDVVVPHPRFRERRFVLAPLAEIAAEWIDPVTGLAIGELLARLDGSASA